MVEISAPERYDNFVDKISSFVYKKNLFDKIMSFVCKNACFCQ